MCGLLASSTILATQANAQALSYDADCPVLYGYNCTDDYYTVSTLPSGLYSFAANKDLLLQLEASESQIPPIDFGCYGHGHFYAFSNDYNWWSGSTSLTMQVYNVNDWSLIDTHTWDDMAVDKGVTFNPGDGKIYTITHQDFDNVISGIDPLTYEVSTVASLPWGLFFTTVFAGPDNRIYHLNTTDYRLYYTDIISGESHTASQPFDFNCAGTCSAVYDFNGQYAYFCCPDYSSTTLYRINIEEGSIQECGTFPENELIAGLFTLDAPADAPASASHIHIEYSSTDRYEATLSFDLPSRTYGGEDLSGQLTVGISVDGTLSTITANAGESAQWVNKLTNGQHIISITVSNAAGTSPERRLKTYTGGDVPGAVGNLRQTLDKETGIVSLTWKAPTKSKLGGSFDTSTLAYRVVRYPMGIVLADGLTECSFTDQLTDAYAHYSYAVIPTVAQGEGVAAYTKAFVWGSINVPPFTEDFEYSEDVDRWTAVNPRGDGYGWTAWSSAYSFGNGKEDCDFYFYSPEMRLSADQTYTLAFEATSGGWDELFSQLQIGLTTTKNINGTITQLFDTLTLCKYEFDTFVADFRVQESGSYYLCFHDITPSWGTQLQIDNVTMLVNSEVTAPDGVGQLTATHMDGGKGVSLSFIAPTATVQGDALSQIDRIEVCRLGQEVPCGTLLNPEPGAQLSFQDPEAQMGRQIYAVTAYSAEQKGMTQHTAAYVGLDTPGKVLQLTAHQPQPGMLQLNWQAPTPFGLNGGYVDVNDLTYSVYRMDDLDGYWTPLLQEGITDLCYTDATTDKAVGKHQQTIVKYQVTASNRSGQSARTSLLVNVGRPYALPFAETFSAARYDTDGWHSHCDAGAAEWKAIDGAMLAVQPFFADGGMLRFANQGFAPAQATLYCPRIDVSDSSAPIAVFYMYHGYEAEPEDLTLSIYAVADDAPAVLLSTLDYNDGTTGWQRHEVSLSGITAATDVQLRLVGYAADNSAAIFVDNLSLSGKTAQDLELTHADFPSAVPANQPAMVNVTVSNTGTQATAPATLALLKNDQTVSQVEVPSLEPNQHTTLCLDMAVALADAYSQSIYQAVIYYDADMFQDNNSSAPTPVTILGNTLPTLELAGTTHDSQVTLSWDEPTPQMAVPLKDDFESYSPWATQGFGPWTTVDVDNTITYWLRYWPTMGNHPYGPFAFEVWNNQQAMAEGFWFEDEHDFWPTRSGQQVLAAFTAIVDPITWDTPVANDNWLISPTIIGGTDVSFWLNKMSSINTEYFELLYTDEPAFDGQDVSDFTLLRRDSLVEAEGWKLITANLPRQATHFAIRHCTQREGYIALLDDVTYTPAEGSVQGITLRGYNIYRDGMLIATTQQRTFTDQDASQGSHQYAVTSVWDEGESMLSNYYVADIAQGIQQVVTDADQVISLYDMAGRLVWCGPAGNAQSAVAPGCYLIYNRHGSVRVVIQ